VLNSCVAMRIRAVAFNLALIAVGTMYPRYAVAQETVLYSFNGASGNEPSGGVTLDKQGNVYGSTRVGGNLSLCTGSGGCGAVFKIVRDSGGTWSDRTLYRFAGGAQDGALPNGPVVLDARGHIFGTTTYGGTGTCNQSQLSGCGTVFELQRSSTGVWTEKIVYNFQGGIDGAYPSGLIVNAAGNLYGTTSLGGSATACVPTNDPTGCGTVFELTPSSGGTWSESVLYRFAGGLDGIEPGGLIFDALGNLYGTTALGGNTQCYEFPGADCGTVYELQRTAAGWAKSTLYLFQGGSDGFCPGGLTFDQSGNLYGTTACGGLYGSPGSLGNGTVYELSPVTGGGWTETVLYRFTGYLDGAVPSTSVILDTSGNLFGLASAGGTSRPNYGGGTLFELTPNSGSEWSETTIYSFQDIATGLGPGGQFIRDSSGNFYGMAGIGGSAKTTYCTNLDGCGVVFEVTQP
jgi:hypothetical protein